MDIFFGDIAIAVGTDNRTAVDDNLIPQAHAVVDDHIWVELYPTTDGSAPAHTYAGFNNRPLAYGNFITNHRTGTDAYFPAQLNIPTQSGRRVNPGKARNFGIKKGQCLGKGSDGIRHPDGRLAV